VSGVEGLLRRRLK